MCVCLCVFLNGVGFGIMCQSQKDRKIEGESRKLSSRSVFIPGMAKTSNKKALGFFYNFLTNIFEILLQSLMVKVFFSLPI